LHFVEEHEVSVCIDGKCDGFGFARVQLLVQESSEGLILSRAHLNPSCAAGVSDLVHTSASPSFIYNFRPDGRRDQKLLVQYLEQGELLDASEMNQGRRVADDHSHRLRCALSEAVRKVIVKILLRIGARNAALAEQGLEVSPGYSCQAAGFTQRQHFPGVERKRQLLTNLPFCILGRNPQRADYILWNLYDQLRHRLEGTG
jgi:hypothetical protein